MERYRIEWAENLAERRKALGMTQADLAAAVGVTRGAVAQWEGRFRAPNDEHKLALAVALRTTVRALFPLIVPEKAAS